jgi:hypothetical protein
MDQQRETDEAKLDLGALNLAAGLARVSPSEDTEVAKALVLADVHPGIEARVICRNPRSATRALAIIYSHEMRKRMNAKWNVAEGGLELPNGSIVAVMLDGKKVVPK